MEMLAVRIILYRWKLQDTRELMSSQTPVFVIFLNFGGLQPGSHRGFQPALRSLSSLLSHTPIQSHCSPRNSLSSQMCLFIASTLDWRPAFSVPFILKIPSLQNDLLQSRKIYLFPRISQVQGPEQAIGNKIAANLSPQLRGKRDG